MQHFSGSVGGAAMRIYVIMGLLGFAFTSACAAQEGMERGATVTDADVGRLGPGETQLVDSGRRELATAEAEHSRMQLNLQEARTEEQAANAEIAAAQAEIQAAELQTAAADRSGDAAAITNAKGQRDRATQHLRSAE